MSEFYENKEVAKYCNNKYFALINKMRVGIVQYYHVYILKRIGNKIDFGKSKQSFTFNINCSIEFLESFIKEKIGEFRKCERDEEND